MRRFPKQYASRDGGFALILVLVGLSLASVLALSIAGDTRTGIAVAQSRPAAARAEALADAGVHAAIFRLLASEPVDGAIMSRYRLVLADGEVVVDVEDEDGKIDLNFAPPELLSGLFRAAGVDLDVTAAVVQHLLRRRGDADPGGFDEMEGGVATADSPLALRPLASVVELRQVPGISQALFERLEPAVTVTSRSDGFDPAVASVLSVRALPGLDPAVVEQLVAGEPVYEIEDFDEAELFILQTRQSFYTIRAQAQTTSGATFARIAVVELKFAPQDPFIVHDWRQAAAAPPVLAPGR